MITTRDRIVSFMKENGDSTRQEIYQGINQIRNDAVRKCLLRMLKRGDLALNDGVYSLVVGDPLVRSKWQNADADKVWRAFRFYRGAWTISDIVRTAGVSHSYVRGLTQRYVSSGHIKKTGKKGRAIQYALLNKEVLVRP